MKRSKFNTLKVLKGFLENINLSKILVFLLCTIVISQELLISNSFAEPSTKTMIITFDESTSRNRNKTINIPNIQNIVNVSVDNGNVSNTLNGENVTINVSNGSTSRTEYNPKKYSKTVTDEYIGKYKGIPYTMSYNEDGYSGTLYKDGAYRVLAGYYNPERRKTESDEYKVSCYSRWERIGSTWYCKHKSLNELPSYIRYDSAGYEGKLYLKSSRESGDSLNRTKNGPPNYCNDDDMEYRTWLIGEYEGTVVKPAEDTRTCCQNYKGTVYKPGYDEYYKYKVTLEYIDNKKPTIDITKPTENKYFGNETGHNTISIEGNTNDADNGERIVVKYTLHNVDNNTDLTGHTDKEIFNVVSDGTKKPFNSNITVDNTIPEGKYTLSVWAVDNKGDKSTVITRNITIDKTPPKINERNFDSTTNNITVNCTALDEKGLAEKPHRYTIKSTSTNWVDNSSYNFTDLVPNKRYTIKIEVSDKAGNISWATDNVYTKAEVPSITVSNPTSITLDLTIEDNNSSNTAYQIVNTSNNNYISSSGEETTSPTWIIPQNKTITIKDLKSQEPYTFKVRAKNEEGIETEFSSPASGTTLAPPPEKVSEVTATATSNEITIHWNPVENATAYEVEADGGEPIDNGTNLSYIHTELLPNSEHNYRVRAKNGAVNGEWSEAITKSTLPLAPVIPTNINTLSTENTITLTWNAVGNAVSYDIEVDGEVISNGNSTNYVHTGLLPNTTHSYRIRSINPAGKSEWSSEVTAKTITDSLPTPMNIVANSGKTSIEIRWNEIVGMEYQIEADGNIIDNGINSIYIHSGLTPDTEHTYRVRSHKGGSYSDWSSPIMVRTSKDIFTAPSNIKSSATDTSIMISWEEVTGADGYDVEADGIIVDNGLNTSFTHEGLMPNTSHIYRIRARQGDTVSDWSSAINIVNISTYALATPKNLRATATETEVVVNWDMVIDADSYDIKINNDLIENIIDTTYTISGLVPGTQKKIMVRAVNVNGTSGFTVPITVITKASSSDSPQNISALTTKNQITLMWEPIQGAVSYDIEANGAVTSAVAANSYTFGELQPNTTYTYKIRVNKADETQGQWSKAVTVTTMADAPDAPLNLTASSTLNSVRLSWDGAVGAVEYEVEAGGQILNAGASNNYLITGLTPNTEYSYKVRAKNPTTVGSWSQPITIKTKSSIQNYNIKGNIGEEKNLVLNAIDIRDFEKYTFTITYNPHEIEIVDIASQTSRTDLSIGNIGRTDIEVIQNASGTLQFKKISPLPIGQSYSGIINSIRIKFKTDAEVTITYTIQ